MRTIVNVDPRFNRDKLKEFLRPPVVVRVNKFTEETLEEFTNDFNEAINTGQPIVPVEVDSYGGSVHSVMGMVTIMEESPIPVATICSTKMMSAGAVLFSFGTDGYRFMHPDATMMIHDASYGTDGKVEDMKVSTQYVDDLNKRMFKKLARHIGKDPEYIMGKIKEHNHLDWFLTAQQAKKLGIVNHLRLPTMEVNVNLEINIG
jgi:ATP-dependent Clp protease protease subunit